MLELKNPHSVMAVLHSRPKDVVEISMLGQPSGAWDEVAALAKANRVPVVAASSLSRRGRREGKEERIGGARAVVKPPRESALEDMFAPAKALPGKPAGLWIALDCVQDPHNLGAIFRTAGFFGVKGIVMTQDRSAPITGTTCDVATGGVETVPFASVVNLKRTLDIAKESGLWVLGTSEHAQEDIRAFSADRSWLLVLGNEERGLRQGTTEACDCLCAIKPLGGVTSLNVSVAAGISIARLSGT